MANKRIIELQERTSIDMGDWLIVDSSTSTRKLSLATLFNYITYSSMIFVTELPTTDISTTTIYLVPHSGSTTDWDEYIYRENEWVLIGTSTIDLSAIYQTKTDNNLETTSKQIVGAINEVNSDLNRNTVGSQIDVKSYTPSNMYVFPSDGYIALYGGTDTGQSISAAIRDSNNNYIATLNCAGYNSNTVFVKKGMKFSVGSSSAQATANFVPLEDN